MQTTPHAIADAQTTIVPAYTERRTKHRLRELCDEVIASYRAATGYQLFSENERQEAHAMLGNLLKAPAGRRA